MLRCVSCIYKDKKVVLRVEASVFGVSMKVVLRVEASVFGVSRKVVLRHLR